MSPRGEDRDGGGAKPAVLRRIGRAMTTPWRALRVDESIAAIRRDFAELRAGGRPGVSRMRLDDAGAFDLDASALPAWSAAAGVRGHARRSAKVDSTQRVDLTWARRTVLSRLALSAPDDDLDCQRNVDGLAVHPGLRGLFPAGVPVRARELSDPDAPQGHGDGISQRARGILAALTPPKTGRIVKEKGGADDAPPFRMWPSGSRSPRRTARPSLLRTRQNVPCGRSVDPPPAPVAHSAPS